MGFPFFYGYYDPLYLFVIIVSLVIMLIAQGLVKGRYSKYSKINNGRNLTGADAAKAVLNSAGVFDVAIEHVAGTMTDHYDPKTNTIRLSDGVYNSTSIAAIGIAAHEAGHAVQYSENYAPIKVRTAIVPFAQYGPMFGVILMLIGMFLNFFNLIVIGLVLFGATFLFQMVTLPVEFNASRRALAAIKENNLLYGEEYSGAKKVLTAAALTYVAAMVQSFLTLLYYIIRFTGNRRD